MKIDAASLLQQLEEIWVDADTLLNGLSHRQFNWRPQPHAWSIAQCLDHLVLFGQQYFPVIAAELKQAQRVPVKGLPSYQLGLIGGFFLRMTEPPVKIKVRAPKLFKPAPQKQLAAISREFQAVQDQAARLIQQAEPLHWGKIKIHSPATTLLRFDLATILAIVAAHERRHLWQAWQVRQHPQFPDS